MREHSIWHDRCGSGGPKSTRRGGRAQMWWVARIRLSGGPGMLGVALLLGVLGGALGVPVSLAAEERRGDPTFAGERFARTELFFGSTRPGGEVTDTEFQQFLDGFVRPRFPDGLTLLVGHGQWRSAEGATVRERSMLLILLYPDAERGENSKRIEE